MQKKSCQHFLPTAFYVCAIVGRGEQCSHVFRVLFIGKYPKAGDLRSPYMVCVLFLSENHKLADDIVKYQHHNVCHYFCYPIVETEK